MTDVLNVLNVLCDKHDTWYYAIRNGMRLSQEYYNIDLIIDNNNKVVISSTPYGDTVEVWTNAHSASEDGKRVSKAALLEYLIYIVKEDFNI